MALALKYQLVSDQSSLFLVYLREGEDKVTELPEIHQVPQMMAAGSHGFGVVSMLAGVTGFGVISSSFSKTISHSQTHPPKELLEHFDKQALAHQDYAHVLRLIQNFSGSEPVRNMIDDFAKQEGITLEQAWAVFLDWLIDRLANEYTSSRQAKRLLRTQTKTFDQTRYAAFQSYLDSKFSDLSASAWH